MLRVMAVLLLIAALGAAADAAEPVLDAAAVPYLRAPARAGYGDFLLMNLPRAFAVALGGAFGWYGGTSIEDMRARALKSCAAKGATDCAIYAEDLQVVWQRRSPVALPVVPGPLIEAPDYAFVPDARFIWRGPQSCSGLPA